MNTGRCILCVTLSCVLNNLTLTLHLTDHYSEKKKSLEVKAEQPTKEERGRVYMKREKVCVCVCVCERERERERERLGGERKKTE